MTLNRCSASSAGRLLRQTANKNPVSVQDEDSNLTRRPTEHSSASFGLDHVARDHQSRLRGMLSYNNRRGNVDKLALERHSFGQQENDVLMVGPARLVRHEEDVGGARACAVGRFTNL